MIVIMIMTTTSHTIEMTSPAIAMPFPAPLRLPATLRPIAEKIKPKRGWKNASISPTTAKVLPSG